MREASSADEDFLFDLYCSTRDDITDAGLEPAQESALLRMQYSARDRAYRVEYPAGEQLVILYDARPVGAYIVEQKENEIRAIDLAILPEYRNRGIGGAVLTQSMEQARAGVRSFVFHVLRSNRALRLYERLGCMRVSESDTHYRYEARALA